MEVQVCRLEELRESVMLCLEFWVQVLSGADVKGTACERSDNTVLGRCRSAGGVFCVEIGHCIGVIGASEKRFNRLWKRMSRKGKDPSDEGCSMVKVRELRKEG